MMGVLADRPPWRVPHLGLFPLPDGALLEPMVVGAGLLAGVAWTLLLDELRDARLLGPRTRDAAADATMHGAWGIVFAIAAAVTEELLFRGAAANLFATVVARGHALDAFALVMGALVSSVAFALMHHAAPETRTRVWLVYGLFGLAQCAFAFTTGSLVGPIVCHALVNFAALVRLRAT